MPFNRASLKNLKPAPRGRAGTVAEVHRIRAAQAVHEWLRAMTPEERGQLLARVMVDGVGTPAPKSSAHAFALVNTRPLRRSDKLRDVSALRVSLATVPVHLQEFAAGVLVVLAEAGAELADGDVLTADGRAFRTAGGGKVQHRHALALHSFGALLPS
jgi:hypothetical protein